MNKLVSHKIVLFTRYGSLGASSRQRFLIFKEHLASRGYSVRVERLLTNDYLRRLYAGRRRSMVELCWRYAKRIGVLLRSAPDDILLIEKELLPWLPAGLERFLIAGRATIIDFDDGWHMRYADHLLWAPVRKLLGSKLERLASSADGVIVANRELVNWALAAGCTQPEYLPTVIDMKSYGDWDEPDMPFTIGWVGTPPNAEYLRSISGPLSVLSSEGARVRAIGAPPDFAIPGVELEVIPWSLKTEPAEIPRCHVGIMPLGRSQWDRYKSGYKLIQYMAAGRPVVASSVGANLDIVSEGETGFLVRTDGEWLRALTQLRSDAALRRRMGVAGRLRCEEQFSIESVADRLVAQIEAAGARRAARGPPVAPLVCRQVRPTFKGALRNEDAVL